MSERDQEERARKIASEECGLRGFFHGVESATATALRYAAEVTAALESLLQSARHDSDQYLLALKDANDRATVAEAALDKSEKNRCAWTEDSDGVWNTGCGEAFIFTEGGGLADNKFVYCYACGKKIDPSPYSDVDLDAALDEEGGKHERED